MTYSTPTTSGTPRPRKTPEHWNAVASLIGAAVSALTFLVGFIGLPAAGVNSPTGTSATVTATVTTSTTVTATPPSSTSSSDTLTDTPSPPDSSAIRWSGRLLLKGEHNLDLVPPEEGANWDIKFDGVNSDGKSATLVHVDMAILPNGKIPDIAECTLLAKTQGTNPVSMPVGASACMLTDDRRPVLIKLNSVNAVANTAQATVKVWEAKQS